MCSFNGGQFHSWQCTMVLSIIVSPPGNHSVRILSTLRRKDCII
ncbi:hypothetical protein GBAR_LOCUS28284 [Geodia barretti]|uniref:Uncharacterized protein n=1 Tax=Geodia barretti TaxID=519541 RepID=A0AA35XAL3_GEOBA|nr:hypothetical protein GBAR_LOCUS28284 [Geodia barretti]